MNRDKSFLSDAVEMISDAVFENPKLAGTILVMIILFYVWFK